MALVKEFVRLFPPARRVLAANNDNQPRASKIHSLPPEILTYIFASLSLKNRKNVRLTCRLWYECSIDNSITKNEKLVFKAGNTAEEITSVLLKFPVSLMNLEFHNFEVDDLPGSFWILFGRKIRTLYFKDCYWDDDTIRSIIVWCNLLTSFIMKQNFCLSWIYTEVNTREHRNIFSSAEMLNDLIKEGVCRRKLHTFAWFTNEFYLPKSVLRRIFLIFPNIKYFGAGADSYDYQFYHNLYFTYSPFSELDECLTSATHLSRLVFNMPTDGRWMENSILKPEWSSRLVEFQTQFSAANSSITNHCKDVFFKLFVVQKDLNILKLRLVHADESFLKELIFHIFDNCLKLCEFHLHFGSSMDDPLELVFTHHEFVRFIMHTSNLKSLSLKNINIILSFPRELLHALPPTNFALDCLVLEQGTTMSYEYCSFILKECSNLTYLELTYVPSDDILQMVFRNLTDLRTLYISCYDSITDFGFTGRTATNDDGYSIKRLKNLKFLYIYTWNVTVNAEAAENIVRELQFPKLTTMKLDLGSKCNKVSTKNIVRLAKNLPKIESFDMNPWLSLSKTLEFCKRAKYLSSVDIYEVDTREALSLFRACASLKSVTSRGNQSIFFFNRFTKTIIRKKVDEWSCSIIID